jgi:uncharacterized RDD family membrane protein YckC
MEYKNAGLLKRFVAFVIDLVLFFTIPFLAVPLFYKTTADTFIPFAAHYLTLLIIFLFLAIPLIVLYQAFFISRFGGTLGKLIMGIKVLNEESNYIDFKTAFLRQTAGYVFSLQFFGLGFWRLLKNPYKRAWHDDLFGTKVVTVRSAILGFVIFILVLAATYYLLFSSILHLTKIM